MTSTTRDQLSCPFQVHSSALATISFSSMTVEIEGKLSSVDIFQLSQGQSEASKTSRWWLEVMTKATRGRCCSCFIWYIANNVSKVPGRFRFDCVRSRSSETACGVTSGEAHPARSVVDHTGSALSREHVFLISYKIARSPDMLHSARHRSDEAADPDYRWRLPTTLGPGQQDERFRVRVIRAHSTACK